MARPNARQRGGWTQQKLTPPTYQFNVHGKQCSYYDRIERLEAEHGFHSSHNQESLASLLFAFFDYWAWRHDYSNQVRFLPC
jgi:hypothetical protein